MEREKKMAFPPFFRIFFFIDFNVHWKLFENVAYSLNVILLKDGIQQQLGEPQHALQPDMLPTPQNTILQPLKLKSFEVSQSKWPTATIMLFLISSSPEQSC